MSGNGPPPPGDGQLYPPLDSGHNGSPGEPPSGNASSLGPLNVSILDPCSQLSLPAKTPLLYSYEAVQYLQLSVTELSHNIVSLILHGCCENWLHSSMSIRFYG